jgi:hypothetical protein
MVMAEVPKVVRTTEQHISPHPLGRQGSRLLVAIPSPFRLR